MPNETPSTAKPGWLVQSRRALWLAVGAIALLTGIVGIFLPLLPTTPFVLLAAFCFSRGSERWERWLVAHPRYGPMVHDWRANRAVPLRAKQMASVMMLASCAWAWWAMPAHLGWIPAACCALVAAWLWRLPTR
jgi:uncharacterized protein